MTTTRCGHKGCTADTCYRPEAPTTGRRLATAEESRIDAGLRWDAGVVESWARYDGDGQPIDGCHIMSRHATEAEAEAEARALASSTGKIGWWQQWGARERHERHLTSTP